MRKVYITALALLLAIPLAPAVGRNVKEIGLRALRKGRITRTKPARAFTRIPADVNYAPDRLLVRFAPNPDLTAPTRAQKDQIVSSLRASIRREFDLVPGLTVVTLPSDQPVNEDLLRRFNSTRDILYAEPDYQIQIQATPNDPDFGNQWALYNPPYGYNDINAKDAWDTETGNDEIVVAVIDTGVNYNHVDLADNMWTNSSGHYGYDFVSDDTNPLDNNGHGTYCAGIIGAVGNNSKGMSGVCWDIRIMALKSFNQNGNGYASNALDAIEYAIQNGAHVLNCSWVYYSGQGYFDVSVAAMEESLNAAGEANIVVAAAAGNYDKDIDTYPYYPPCCDCDNVIVVGASTSDGTRWHGSNYGSTKVDLFAPGDNIYTCSLIGYTYQGATSMAAPHVAGACALLLSRNPSLSYEEVKDIIMDNVTSVGALSGYCVSGGILNAHAAVIDSDTSFVANPSVLGRDSSGNIKAWVDRWGNLVLKGTFQQSQSTHPTPIGGFKIKNSVGTVIASLDTAAGNMRIAGQCYEFCSSPLTPTNPNWVIKASDGAVQAYLNSSGNLYMTGEVFDGI